MKKHWPRWIKSSIITTFKANKEDTYTYFEGDTRDVNAPNDRFEFRMDGPDIFELSKNYYELVVTINVLVRSETGNDFYKQDRMIGEAIEALSKIIPVYKFGDDSNELLGCLDMLGDKEITNFGPDAEGQIYNSTVECLYKMKLVGD